MGRDREVDRAVNHMRECYMERISISDLEVLTGVSRYSLARSFQRRFGVPPMRWLWAYRVKMAAYLLMSKPNWSCTEVGYQCGFETPGHFNRRFRVTYGLPPGLFRRRG